MSTFTSYSGRTRSLLSNTAKTAAFDEIPIISLSAPEDELVPRLRHACTTVGFFYIKDHGVCQSVIDDTFQCAEGFFAQEEEIKNEIDFKKSDILRGYESLAKTRTDESKRADLNECFNCGYETFLDPQQSARGVDGESSQLSQSSITPSPPVTGGNAIRLQGPNAWPSQPGFKTAVSIYYGEVLTLARRLARLFAVVLELPPNFFDDMITTPGAMMRLIHYPPQDPKKEDALGIGAHTDIECFTILCQGTQPALQILNVEGAWIEAPPVPGTFVVNIGDLLARWSNDVFISTVHRVLNVTGHERYSIPFFFGPDYNTVIEPLRTCVDKEIGAKYEPILAGEYVWRRLCKSRLTDEETEARRAVLAAA